MKTKLLLLLLFSAVTSHAQITIDKDKREIHVDAESKITSFKTTTEKGYYTLIIKNPNCYNIAVERNIVLQPALSTTIEEASNLKRDSLKCANKSQPVSFENNTEYIFTIYEDSSEKIYKIKSANNWSWSTTFGGNVIFFTNRSKYISHKNEDGGTSVKRIQDGKSMDVMPAIMFTFLNNHKNYSIGPTGGLGVNFQEISLFTGLSLGLGQNFVLTGGVAFHKQMRPNSVYYEGQIIDSSLTNDNLNESMYRINPFLGLSFRFDKNPFGAKSE